MDKARQSKAESLHEWKSQMADFLLERAQKFGAQQMFTLIGMLTALRVKCDTHIAEIRENRTYPLNQSQISRLTEDMMYRYYQNGKVTVWDLYNGATELYKADTMDIPALLPQNRAMVGFLSEQFGI